MEDLLVLLDRNDMVITLDGNSLRVQRSGVKTQHIPLGLTGQVVVYGRPLISCDVWRQLSERGIPAVLLFE